MSQVEIHPEFNPSLLDNDFSLLKLESKIEITKYVSPVCLPEDASEDFGDGTFAIATGWGREASTNGNQYSLHLIKKILPFETFFVPLKLEDEGVLIRHLFV